MSTMKFKQAPLPSYKWFRLLKSVVVFMIPVFLLILLVSACNEEDNPTEPLVVAMPVFDPVSGTFDQPQLVSISCETLGAAIHYTTNGSTPTSSSSAYTSPLMISESATVKAKAFKEGYTASPTASAQYVINESQVSTPIISPADGVYNTELVIIITCITSQSSIRYTTNGGEPDQNSLLYTSPFSISSSKTIKARAYKDGLAPSPIAVNNYTIDNISVATPLFNPPGGTYSAAQAISISCATAYATIRYTTDGSNPNSSSQIYTEPILASLPYTNIKAKAFKQGLQDSQITSEMYYILQNLDPPLISVNAPNSPAGVYYVPQFRPIIRLSHTLSNAQIRYTVDGSEPDQYSTLYQNQFALPYNTSVSSVVVLKARAFADGYSPSNSASATYRLIYDVYNHDIAWGDIDRLSIGSGLALGVNYYTGLYLYDIDPQSSTSFVGYLGSDFVPQSKSVCANGNYAFVVGSFGLFRVNISNPSNPVLAGSMQSIGNSGDVTYGQGYVFAAVSTGFKVIDGSNSSMALASNYTVASGSVNRLAFYDNCVYLAKNDGVEIVSVDNPSSPQLLSTITGYNNISSIWISDNRLFAGIIGTTNNRTLIFDVHNPHNPIFITSIERYSPSVSASGNVLCIDGLLIDISDTNNPIALALVDTGSIPNDVIIYGSYLYTTDSALKVVNISSIIQSKRVKRGNQ